MVLSVCSRCVWGEVGGGRKGSLDRFYGMSDSSIVTHSPREGLLVCLHTVSRKRPIYFTRTHVFM